MVAFEVIMLILCLLGSAFFSGIETGVISINRLRLRHLVRRNVSGAKILQDFLMKPDRLLGTTLTGTNLCHVVAAVFAASLGVHWLGARGAVVFGVALTLVILVFCEYLPKAWFQSFPAARTLPFARLLYYSQRVLWPIGALITGLVKRLVPSPSADKQNGQPFISREELRHLAKEGHKTGLLTADEHRMIHGVFELKTKTCGEIMQPRDRIVFVQHDTPAADLMKLAREKVVNRFPVYDREKKAYVGILHIFDVLADAAPEDKAAQNYMRPVQFVSIFTPVDHLLPRMRVTRLPMALVTDERFEVVGLVTLEDVLDEVVGQPQP